MVSVLWAVSILARVIFFFFCWINRGSVDNKKIFFNFDSFCYCICLFTNDDLLSWNAVKYFYLDFTEKKQELNLNSQYALDSVKGSRIEGGKSTNVLRVVLIL